MQEVGGSSPSPPTKSQSETLLPQDKNRPSVHATGRPKGYKKGYTLLLLIALLGCRGASAYEPPATLTPYNAPLAYVEWWGEAQACVGVEDAELRRVSWYTAGGGERRFPCPFDPEGCWGLWVSPHTIYMADPYVLNEIAVKHEMLHDLLQTGEHPLEFDWCAPNWQMVQ